MYIWAINNKDLKTKMADFILNIESSTGVCSVSISGGFDIISFRESKTGRSHAALLTVFVEEVMKESGLKFSELSAVAVSGGPGSYTGLRIGVSAAKGICYAAGLPLIAVNTLATMAQMVLSSHNELVDENCLLCPMIDARRMEVYMALFDYQGRQTSEISAEIIDENTFGQLPAGKKLLFFGDGAEKCKDVISYDDNFFIPDIYPSAALMRVFSEKALKERRFEDTAYYTPFYLKDFIATTPKNKML